MPSLAARAPTDAQTRLPHLAALFGGGGVATLAGGLAALRRVSWGGREVVGVPFPVLGRPHRLVDEGGHCSAAVWPSCARRPAAGDWCRLKTRVGACGGVNWHGGLSGAGPQVSERERGRVVGLPALPAAARRHVLQSSWRTAPQGPPEGRTPTAARASGPCGPPGTGWLLCGSARRPTGRAFCPLGRRAPASAPPLACVAGASVLVLLGRRVDGGQRQGGLPGAQHRGDATGACMKTGSKGSATQPPHRSLHCLITAVRQGRPAEHRLSPAPVEGEEGGAQRLPRAPGWRAGTLDPAQIRRSPLQATPGPPAAHPPPRHPPATARMPPHAPCSPVQAPPPPWRTSCLPCATPSTWGATSRASPSAGG